MQKKTKIKIVAFIISFLWIGLGTLMQISSYPTCNLLEFDYNSLIFNILYYITFPFNITLFTLLFFEKLNDVFLIVILLQSIKVPIYWWIFYKIFSASIAVKSKKRTIWN